MPDFTSHAEEVQKQKTIADSVVSDAPPVDPPAPDPIPDVEESPQVAVQLAPEYEADGPTIVGFAGYEVTLTPGTATEVDQAIAEQLTESPVVVYA